MRTRKNSWWIRSLLLQSVTTGNFSIDSVSSVRGSGAAEDLVTRCKERRHILSIAAVAYA